MYLPVTIVQNDEIRKKKPITIGGKVVVWCEFSLLSFLPYVFPFKTTFGVVGAKGHTVKVCSGVSTPA